MLTFSERSRLELFLLKEGWVSPEKLRAQPESERFAMEQLLARYLQERGVIHHVFTRQEYPDEPPMHTSSIDFGSHNGAGGMALNPADALRSGLAEAVERQVWAHEFSHLPTPQLLKAEDLPTHTPRLSDYLCSDSFRSKHSQDMDTVPLHWSRMHSLVHKKKSWAPTHLISPQHPLVATDVKIRQPITTGLATAPRRHTALVRAILEVIERDAFMVTWLGRLTSPKLTHASLEKTLSDLALLLARCKKFQLDVSFVLMPTDAPTYAMLAVVRDPYNAPPITVGTAASQHAGVAALKALLEALRARRNSRSDRTRNEGKKKFRYEYWHDLAHVPQASFLTEGPELDFTPAPWNMETDRAHATRLISWAKAAQYDILLADVSKGVANVPGWYIYFTIIPQLHPLYQAERMRCTDLRRIKKQKDDMEPADLNLHPHPFV